MCQKLLEIQVHSFSWISLIHMLVDPLQKLHRAKKTRFPLAEATLVVVLHSSNCFVLLALITVFNSVPGTVIRLKKPALSILPAFTEVAYFGWQTSIFIFELFSHSCVYTIWAW